TTTRITNSCASAHHGHDVPGERTAVPAGDLTRLVAGSLRADHSGRRVDRVDPPDRCGRHAPARSIRRRPLQPRQATGPYRRGARVSGVVLRVPGRRRRVVSDVAVADLEWAAGG